VYVTRQLFWQEVNETQVVAEKLLGFTFKLKKLSLQKSITVSKMNQSSTTIDGNDISSLKI